MRKILTAAFCATLVLVVCIVGLRYFGWSPTQRQVVFVGEGQRLDVAYTVQPRIYVSFAHNLVGFYLRPGATRVDGGAWRFSADEELKLFAIHQHDKSVYIIFETRYESWRGFVVYKLGADGIFRMQPVGLLPPEVAYPNFGDNVENLRGMMISGKRPNEEFYHTNTAQLWSQMITGKPYPSQRMDIEAIDAFWKTWAPVFREKMSER